MKISESIDRILRQADTLADLFYLVFLERYPAVQSHFFGVDMKRQNLTLTIALMAVERFYQFRYAAIADYLQMLGEQHKRRGIRPDQYPLWRDALLATLARFHGPEWSEPLGHEWCIAIDAAVEAMLAAYGEPSEPDSHDAAQK